MKSLVDSERLVNLDIHAVTQVLKNVDSIDVIELCKNEQFSKRFCNNKELFFALLKYHYPDYEVKSKSSSVQEYNDLVALEIFLNESYYEAELAEDLNHDLLLQIIQEWELEEPIPDDVATSQLAKIVYFVSNGAPEDALVIVSNSSGYYKLAQVDDTIILFTSISDYNESKTLNSILGESSNEDESDFIENLKWILVEWNDVEAVIPGLQQEVHKTWPTRIPDEDWYGNTCLLQLKTRNRYRYVRGGKVLEFDLDEPVEDYYSFVQNNTVPEPLIVTATKVYAPEFGRYWNRDEISEDVDLRNEFPMTEQYQEVYERDSSLGFFNTETVNF